MDLNVKENTTQIFVTKEGNAKTKETVPRDTLKGVKTMKEKVSAHMEKTVHTTADPKKEIRITVMNWRKESNTWRKLWQLLMCPSTLYRVNSLTSSMKLKITKKSMTIMLLIG